MKTLKQKSAEGEVPAGDLLLAYLASITPDRRAKIMTGAFALLNLDDDEALTVLVAKTINPHLDLKLPQEMKLRGCGKDRLAGQRARGAI